MIPALIDSERASRRLVEALRSPACYPHPVDTVEIIETHISFILLAGEHAYKILKPVDLGFLDFTTLARRREDCHRALVLNRRFNRRLYLEVTPITGSTTQPRIGGSGEPVEYALHMQRFDPARTLDHLIADRPPAREDWDALAHHIGTIHAGLPRAPECSLFGSPEVVRESMLDNFDAIEARLPDRKEQIDALRTRTREWLSELANDFDLRWRGGWIRECHGDLHLANLLQEPERPIEVFDCLEFSDRLRIIDTLSDIAFLLMDLDYHARRDLAHRVLDQYLEAANDYMGLTLLRPYLAYRAMVRAKVAAIGLLQAREIGDRARERETHDSLESHLSLAERYLTSEPEKPLLILMHGVSGSGKSRLAMALVETMGAIRIRSDVERKRLLGLTPDEDTRKAGVDAYTPAMTRATYRRLRALAFGLLDAGMTVIVDATFLRREQRRPFLQMAHLLGVPVRILDVTAPDAILRQRVMRRQQACTDPSEAGLEILETQLRSREALTAEEQAIAIALDTSQPIDIPALARELGAAQITPCIPDVVQK